MNKLSVLFFITCLTLLIGGCGQKAKKAKAYHQQVLNTVRVVIDGSLDFADAVQSYNKTKAAQGFEQYSSLVNRTISKVKDEGTFDDDTILQHYALETLGFYQSSLQTGFKPLINGLQSEDFNDEQKHMADSLCSDLSINDAQYWKRFNWAEGQFDQKFGITTAEEK
jgi:hypothetical protein